MPIKRTAWACKWGCRRNVTTSKQRMARHEERCWWNPARRACVTCRHCNQYVDDNGMVGTPYQQTWSVRECAADAGIDLQEGLRRDCDWWVNKEGGDERE